MARYLPTITTDTPETLDAQPGQWVSYGGTIGRFMGRRQGTVWIAWGGTARKRFKGFAGAFRAA